MAALTEHGTAPTCRPTRHACSARPSRGGWSSPRSRPTRRRSWSERAGGVTCGGCWTSRPSGPGCRCSAAHLLDWSICERVLELQCIPQSRMTPFALQGGCHSTVHSAFISSPSHVRSCCPCARVCVEFELALVYSTRRPSQRTSRHCGTSRHGASSSGRRMPRPRGARHGGGGAPRKQSSSRSALRGRTTSRSKRCW